MGLHINFNFLSQFRKNLIPSRLRELLLIKKSDVFCDKPPEGFEKYYEIKNKGKAKENKEPVQEKKEADKKATTQPNTSKESNTQTMEKLNIQFKFFNPYGGQKGSNQRY